MLEEFIYSSKQNFEDVVKYQGEPKCLECLVRACCFNAKVDNDCTYVVLLNEPCDEAFTWFDKGEIFDDFIDEYMESWDIGVGIEQIKYIIQNSGDESIHDVVRKYGLNDSAMKAFTIFFNPFYNQIINSDEDRSWRRAKMQEYNLLQEFLKSIIEK